MNQKPTMDSQPTLGEDIEEKSYSGPTNDYVAYIAYYHYAHTKILGQPKMTLDELLDSIHANITNLEAAINITNEGFNCASCNHWDNCPHVTTDFKNIECILGMFNLDYNYQLSQVAVSLVHHSFERGNYFNYNVHDKDRLFYYLSIGCLFVLRELRVFMELREENPDMSSELDVLQPFLNTKFVPEEVPK